MNRARVLLISTAAAVALSGGVVAGGWQEGPPQDATPAPDPIGDVLRSDPTEEAAPAGDPAPAVPIAITPPAPAATTETTSVEDDDADHTEDADEDDEEGESEAEKAERLTGEPVTPRQRRRVAIVEAIDKITAERMRFEVEVGGRPVRFNQALIFTARACEVTGEEETVQDAIAYLDVTLQARGAQAVEPRQIFRGWMYASTPALSGLQHPIYDAWVIGCKA